MSIPRHRGSPASHAVQPTQDFTGPPFVGALLRIPWQEARRRIFAALDEAGFSDIGPAHFPVVQYPPPDGVRPIDLAERAMMSKQAMNYLITQMEARGYLERRTVAHRGRLVFLTAKGWRVTETIFQAMRDLETEWARELGPARYRQFRQILVKLAQLTERHSTKDIAAVAPRVRRRPKVRQGQPK